MAEYTDREAFIPYRRSDLIDLCIEDGQLDGKRGQQFRDFCEILGAYYHFKTQKTLEELKRSFSPFDPDADTIERTPLSPEQCDEMEGRLIQAFESILKCANYRRLTDEELQASFEDESLIPLKTRVDFDDYERIIFYYRGDNFEKVTVKRWFRTVEKDVDNLQRVALLFKFKDKHYFEEKGTKLEEQNFVPGKMYIYLYKNVPRPDLELLFPNVKVSMNLIDRLLFIIPAIGGAVPILIKVLPSLLLIVGILLLLTVGEESASTFANVKGEDAQNIMPVLVGVLSVGITLGGFAVKQYTSYKNKRLKFLKQVTDTLFFKNLVTNRGVLYTLVDAAEEEECKEIILVYYHLLTAERPLTSIQLDDRIETWMDTKFQTRIDFDIQKTLKNLAALHAPMQGQTRSLLTVDAQGVCHVPPIDEAKTIIDHVWDNIFQYA